MKIPSKINSITFIGDVHGHLKRFINITKRYEFSIQVGDMGIFCNEDKLPAGNYGFIRGNHDNPELCKSHPNYMGDTFYSEEWNMYGISGAKSIDIHKRKEGVNYWIDEELSNIELTEAIQTFEALKPNVIFSHTAPKKIVEILCGNFISCMTSHALQFMLEYHKPKFWVCGHFHKSKTIKYDGTTFIFLSQLHNFTLKRNQL